MGHNIYTTDICIVPDVRERLGRSQYLNDSAYYCNGRCFKSKQSLDCIFFRFPDTCVWGKHSAWTSTHHRAEARTHYTQRNGTQKPPSEREGDHEVVEGARVTFSLREFYCHALSLSRLRRQLPPGGSLSHISTDRKHHQRKILGGVRVFSTKDA